MPRQGCTRDPSPHTRRRAARCGPGRRASPAGVTSGGDRPRGRPRADRPPRRAARRARPPTSRPPPRARSQPVSAAMRAGASAPGVRSPRRRWATAPTETTSAPGAPRRPRRGPTARRGQHRTGSEDRGDRGVHALEVARSQAALRRGEHDARPQPREQSPPARAGGALPRHAPHDDDAGDEQRRGELEPDAQAQPVARLEQPQRPRGGRDARERRRARRGPGVLAEPPDPVVDERRVPRRPVRRAVGPRQVPAAERAAARRATRAPRRRGPRRPPR